MKEVFQNLDNDWLEVLKSNYGLPAGEYFTDKEIESITKQEKLKVKSQTVIDFDILKFFPYLRRLEIETPALDQKSLTIICNLENLLELKIT